VDKERIRILVWETQMKNKVLKVVEEPNLGDREIVFVRIVIINGRASRENLVMELYVLSVDHK